MQAFKLPESFYEDSDVKPAVDFESVDPREHALDCLVDLADMLYGDIVLVPFAGGEPDWSNTRAMTDFG